MARAICFWSPLFSRSHAINCVPRSHNALPRALHPFPSHPRFRGLVSPPVPRFPPTSRNRGAAVPPIRGMSSVSGEAATHRFGPYTIRSSEVFASTPLSLALVNLKPVVPGHVLIIPRRVALRFQDLSQDEVTDIWTLAQRVGRTIEPYFGAVALTFAIQDGAAAGQTVPHVHIHCLPRKLGDFKNNDEVYDKIDEKAEQLKERLDLDKERVVRTPDEMAAEAAELRALFTQDN